MAFERFPDNSKIWIYGFNNNLSPKECELITAKLNNFVSNWTWHGAAVTGAFKLIENRFVILAATDSISGCSIDSSVAVFKELKQENGLDATNLNLIYFRQNNEIRSLTRNEFQSYCGGGSIKPSTAVFNLMISSLAEFRAGKFEIAFQESWHSKAFQINEEILF